MPVARAGRVRVPSCLIHGTITRSHNVTTGSLRRAGSQVAVLGLAGLMLVALSGCASSSASGAPSGSPFAQATATGPVAIVGELDVGGDGWAMTKAGGALWIQVDPPVDAIVRVDVATGAAMPVISGGIDAKSGPEGLWVVCCNGIARVDPATGKLELKLELDGAFALAEGSVWTLSESGLQEVDPQTGMAIGGPVGSAISATLCGAWKDLVVAFGSAWLACKEGRVVRIEIPGGDVTTITTAAGAHTFAVSEDAVWVTNYQAGSVSRIDPQSGATTTISGAGSGVGIAYGAGYIWAAAEHGIAKIDPGTNAIVGLIELGWGEYYELVWDDGIIWASTRRSHVVKVDSSKVEPVM
jgi:hypothetical protein